MGVFFIINRHVTQLSTNQVVTQTSKDIARLTVLMRRGDKEQKLQIEKLTTDFKDAMQRYSEMQLVRRSYFKKGKFTLTKFSKIAVQNDIIIHLSLCPPRLLRKKWKGIYWYPVALRIHLGMLTRIRRCLSKSRRMLYTKIFKGEKIFDLMVVSLLKYRLIDILPFFLSPDLLSLNKDCLWSARKELGELKEIYWMLIRLCVSLVRLYISKEIQSVSSSRFFIYVYLVRFEMHFFCFSRDGSIVQKGNTAKFVWYISDTIENSIENVHGNVELGAQELVKASSYQSKFRRKVCFLLILAIVAAVILTIILVTKLS